MARQYTGEEVLDLVMDDDPMKFSVLALMMNLVLKMMWMIG